MENEPKGPWWQNGGFVAGVGVAGLIAFGLIGAASGTAPAPSSASASAQPAAAAAAVAAPSELPARYAPVSERLESATPPAPEPARESVPLSNDTYYTNSAGNQVHSPAYAPAVPAGASARCRDGTYSFSQSRRGTCSHHGGVAQWL